MKKLHLANAAGRDATIAYDPLSLPRTYTLGLAGKDIQFKRFVAAAPGSTDDELFARYGEAYGQALVDDDPDADMEIVGRRLGKLDTVYLTARGEVLYASPQVIEILYDTAGEERGRREPQEEEANVADEVPVRWTGRKIGIADAVRRFAFRRHVQLRHVDGLSYDFLYAMAKELHDEGVMVRLGAGDRGRSPLRFQYNGSPYQGFLEGRIDNSRYQLVLHLSNLELKRPEEA